jgi:hypothetical protein
MLDNVTWRPAGPATVRTASSAQAGHLLEHADADNLVVEGFAGRAEAQA